MKSNKWSFNDIPDLAGKVIIVTGGNTGLGYEAVKLFSKRNAEVILASRIIDRGNAAKERIQAEYPHANITVQSLDLADLSSIHDFADGYAKQYKKLDILLNNAGIMWCPYGKTKDGFESQMGINHLGHFALTGLLLSCLKNTPQSRVVTVSSLGHRSGHMDFDNLLFEKGGYKPTQAYFNSKLANLLFTYELQRKFEQHNIDCIAVAAHPGGSATDLSRHVEGKIWFKLLYPIFILLAQSALMGTLPEVRAAVDSNVKGGEYYGPRSVGEMRGYPVLVESTADSHNVADAKKLWDISKKLTNVEYILN